MRIRMGRTLGFLLLAAVMGPAAPTPAEEVPYIPTPTSVVDAMLSIASVGPQDYVVDLGSGDGRIVIAAAKKYGARALGIDYDPLLVERSWVNAAREGVSDRVSFLHQNIFDSNIRDATVVTMYLLPEVNLELRPRLLLDMKPGTRVVSHDWDMGAWQADRRMVVEAPDKTVGLKKESAIYLWIVPARVAGYWRGTLAGPQGEEAIAIEVQQRFQNASANVWLRRWSLAGTGRLRGEDLSLHLERSPWIPGAAPLRFTLRASGNRIEGEALDGTQRYVLRATRVVE